MMGRSKSDSCAPVTIPSTTAVAGVGGPGADTVWLPAPEEAISTRIKHCREFQAFAKEQIQPVPVVMHRDIVAGLDSRGNESQRKGMHCARAWERSSACDSCVGVFDC